MRKLRSIIVKAKIYPWQSLQDTPAGQEQIKNARKFIEEIERLAAKHLPANNHSLKIKEKYHTEDR